MSFTLRQARRYRDKTITDMADMLNISRTTYIRLEANPTNIKLSTALSISDYLDIPIDDFIFTP